MRPRMGRTEGTGARMVTKTVVQGLSTILLLLPLSANAQERFIAGVDPSVRPPDAPVMAPLKRDDAWFAQALRGVEEPFPPSLDFLQDQGRWYTPFLHPGMTPPYDLRGWH